MFLSFLLHGTVPWALEMYHLEKTDRISSELTDQFTYGVVLFFNISSSCSHSLDLILVGPMGIYPLVSFSNFLECKFSKYFLAFSEFFSNFTDFALLCVFSETGKEFVSILIIHFFIWEQALWCRVLLVSTSLSSSLIIISYHALNFCLACYLFFCDLEVHNEVIYLRYLIWL